MYLVPPLYFLLFSIASLLPVTQYCPSTFCYSVPPLYFLLLSAALLHLKRKLTLDFYRRSVS